MSFDDDLRDRLTRRAGQVQVTGDLPGVLARAGRRDASRMALLAGVAAVVVVGAGAVGFAVGRTAGSGANSASGGAPVETAPPDAQPDQAPSDDVPPSTMSPAPGAVPAPSPDGAGDALATSPDEFGRFQWAWNDPWAGAEYLASRTTETGLSLRAHRRLWGGAPSVHHDLDPASSFMPPPGCFPTGEVRVAVAGTGTIDVGLGSWIERPGEEVSVMVFELGRVDGVPVRAALVQVPAAVNAVTGTWSDGAADTATPENGVVLLAVPGEGSAAQVVLTLDVESGDTTVDVQELATASQADWSARCLPPPPALPAPGEQPADVEVATEAVVATVAAVYEFSSEPDDRIRWIDDPSGVAGAMEDVANGPFAEAALSATVTVNEVVFTSPTEAHYRYTITTNLGTFANRFGRALLTDDGWKLTRDTVCQDLSLGGSPCPGELVVGPIDGVPG